MSLNEVQYTYVALSDVLRIAVPVVIIFLIVISALGVMLHDCRSRCLRQGGANEAVVKQLENTIAQREQARDAGIMARTCLKEIIHAIFENSEVPESVKRSAAMAAKRLGVQTEHTRDFLNNRSSANGR